MCWKKKRKVSSEILCLCTYFPRQREVGFVNLLLSAAGSSVHYLYCEGVRSLEVTYFFFKKTHEYFAGTKWTVRDREVSVSVWEVRLYLLKLFFGLSRKVSLEGLRYNPNNGREKKATLSQNDGLLLFITCKRFRWLAKLERKLRSKTTSKYG